MINLRAISENDLPHFLRWRNDKNIRKYFREWHELTVIDEAQWFERLSGDGKTAMFAVEERSVAEGEAPKLIGCAGLTGIDWFERSAEVSLYLGEVYIDERAEAVLKELIRVAFLDYGLHRLWTEVWAFDAQKADALKAVGFKHEGTHAKAHWYNGSWHDSVWFGLVNKDKE